VPQDPTTTPQAGRGGLRSGLRLPNRKGRERRPKAFPHLSLNNTARAFPATWRGVSGRPFRESLISDQGSFHLSASAIFLKESIKGGAMYPTLPAEIRKGRINLLEKTKIPEGTRLLVTIIPEDEKNFWLNASQTSLKKVWDNQDDDVYEKLLGK
jgi:hypothetical protein